MHDQIGRAFIEPGYVIERLDDPSVIPLSIRVQYLVCPQLRLWSHSTVARSIVSPFSGHNSADVRAVPVQIDWCNLLRSADLGTIPLSEHILILDEMRVAGIDSCIQHCPGDALAAGPVPELSRIRLNSSGRHIDQCGLTSVTP